MGNGKGIRTGDPRSERGLEGCSSLLHLRTCREKMFMVMASHGDLKKLGVGTPAFAVAGLLASQYAWEEYGSLRNALGSREVDPGLFLSVLESAGIMGIGAVAGAAASNAMPPSSETPPFPSRSDDPHLICFEHCVLGAARRMHPAPAGETVCFVMDWHDPLAASALWRLEELMNFSPLPVRERLGALGFERGDDFPPLQSARWLAKRCLQVVPGRDSRVTSREFNGVDWTFLDGTSLTRLRVPLRTS